MLAGWGSEGWYIFFSDLKLTLAACECFPVACINFKNNFLGLCEQCRFSLRQSQYYECACITA